MSSFFKSVSPFKAGVHTTERTKLGAMDPENVGKTSPDKSPTKQPSSETISRPLLHQASASTLPPASSTGSLPLPIEHDHGLSQAPLPSGHASASGTRHPSTILEEPLGPQPQPEPEQEIANGDTSGGPSGAASDAESEEEAGSGSTSSHQEGAVVAYNDNEQYMMTFAEHYGNSGSPMTTLGEAVEAQASKLGMGPVSSAYDWDTITLLFGTKTAVVKYNASTNTGRMDDVQTISNEGIMSANEPDVPEVRAELNGELSQNLSSTVGKLLDTLLDMLAYAVCSAMAASVAFGGRGWDIAVGFLLGTMYGFSEMVLSARLKNYSALHILVCGIATTYLSLVFSENDRFCFSALAQGALVLALPGYKLTVAFKELLLGQKIGITRFAFGLLDTVLVMISFGTGILIYVRQHSDFKLDLTCSTTNWPSKANYGLVLPFLVAMGRLAKSHKKQLVMMVIFAMIAYVTQVQTAGKLNEALPNFKLISQLALPNIVSACALGVSTGLYTYLPLRRKVCWRFFDYRCAAANMVVGIYIIVYGSIASGGGLVVNYDNFGQTVASAFLAIMVASGTIAVGLVLAQIIMVGLVLGYCKIAEKEDAGARYALKMV